MTKNQRRYYLLLSSVCVAYLLVGIASFFEDLLHDYVAHDFREAVVGLSNLIFLGAAYWSVRNQKIRRVILPVAVLAASFAVCGALYIREPLVAVTGAGLTLAFYAVQLGLDLIPRLKPKGVLTKETFSKGRLIWAFSVSLLVPTVISLFAYTLPPRRVIDWASVDYIETPPEPGILLRVGTRTYGDDDYKWPYVITANLVSRESGIGSPWRHSIYPVHARFYEDIYRRRDAMKSDSFESVGYTSTMTLPYNIIEGGIKQLQGDISYWEQKPIRELVNGPVKRDFAVQINLYTATTPDEQPTSSGERVQRYYVGLNDQEQPPSFNDYTFGFAQSRFGMLTGRTTAVAQSTDLTALSVPTIPGTPIVPSVPAPLSVPYPGELWKVIEVNGPSVKVAWNADRQLAPQSRVEIYFILEEIGERAIRAEGMITGFEARTFFVSVLPETKSGEIEVGDFVDLVQ